MSFDTMNTIVNKFFADPIFKTRTGQRMQERSEVWMNERYEELMNICIRGKRTEGGWYASHTASASDDAVAYLMDLGDFQSICEAFQGNSVKGFDRYINHRVEAEAEIKAINGDFNEQE